MSPLVSSQQCSTLALMATSIKYHFDSVIGCPLLLISAAQMIIA